MVGVASYVTNVCLIPVASMAIVMARAGSVSATRTGVVYFATRTSITAVLMNLVKTVALARILHLINIVVPVRKGFPDLLARKLIIHAHPILVSMERLVWNSVKSPIVNVHQVSPDRTVRPISTSALLNHAKTVVHVWMVRTASCVIVHPLGKVYYASSMWTSVR